VTAVDPTTSAWDDARDGTERAPTPAVSASPRRRDVVRAYVAMTKPRIIELLLVTTLPAMVLAEGGLPPLGLVLATLSGGALAAGSAHAFNQVYERDIDALMHRTARRPLATAAVTPRAAIVFGSVLLALAVAIMLVWVNPLAAALTVAANLFYVVIYTMLLKRRTSQNIVWGGAAGCMPTLIGWAAVTNSLALAPVLLFLVVFFWTPAHYWPLAIRFREDYARAGVPMLPVVVDAPAVGRSITAYAVATVVTTLVLWPVAGLGWLYGAVALVAGGWFVGEAARLWRRAARGADATTLAPMRVFHGSITYLTIVFAALAADVLLLG
jgi:protoheme IX farnesyltransferase